MVETIINRGRRDYNELCSFYKVVNAYKDKSELVRSEAPSGYFYARNITQRYQENLTHAGILMVDNNSIQLETRDNINLSPNDVVVYRKKTYIVESTQPTYEYKNKMFINDEYQASKTIISLRGGK